MNIDRILTEFSKAASANISAFTAAARGPEIEVPEVPRTSTRPTIFRESGPGRA